MISTKRCSLCLHVSVSVSCSPSCLGLFCRPYPRLSLHDVNAMPKDNPPSIPLLLPYFSSPSLPPSLPPHLPTYLHLLPLHHSDIPFAPPPSAAAAAAAASRLLGAPPPPPPRRPTLPSSSAQSSCAAFPSLPQKKMSATFSAASQSPGSCLGPVTMAGQMARRGLFLRRCRRPRGRNACFTRSTLVRATLSCTCQRRLLQWMLRPSAAGGLPRRL